MQRMAYIYTTENRTAEPTRCWPLEAKSGKQKNVTKSSTEAELVALSDHAGRGINLRNFLAGQRYGTVQVIIYQDNMSCMAIMREEGQHRKDRDISTSGISGSAKG
jgi:hypothetical protein